MAHKYPHLWDILKLSRWERITHHKSRKHLLAGLMGLALMIFGSFMAGLTPTIEAVPHPLWDSVAYFIHGVGCIPILRHIEPLWLIIVGE